MFVAAEAVPFAKAGGLGDVIGALPKALSRLGVKVSVFLPRYGFVSPAFPPVASFSVDFGGEQKEVRILEAALPRSAVPVWLLDFPPYYDRPGIYGQNDQDYPDNLQRFAFLCKAAVVACAKLGEIPDVFHVHDWHTALLPLYARAEGVPEKTVLTIHNLAFQGWFPRSLWENLDLPEESLALAGQGDWLCALRAGILAAEFLTTVSPTYAQEILREGLGLEEALRAKAPNLQGILNGIDTEEWNPQTDPHLWARYSPLNLRGKALNRRQLCRALALAPENPVVAMVGRLTEQKGLDLLLPILDEIMALGVNLVVLGTGETHYAEFLREKETQWRGRLRALLEFSEPWAHRLLGGADFLLMPSRFEPCGLTQLYALRYGTIPIVRATGGLRDTVRDVTEGGNGFVFEEYSSQAVAEALRRAVHFWRQKPQDLLDLRRAAISGDYSWEPAAQKYLEVYTRVLSR